MKPRDSIPITLSIRSPFQRATRASITARKVTASESTGVMSLKTIPFFGKSGTSRILARTASIMGPDLTTGAAPPGALEAASGEEEQGVARARALAHLEVQVRSGGPPGLPHLRDDLPPRDPGAVP